MGDLFHREPETRLLGTIRQVFGQLRKVASKLGGFAGSIQSTVDTTCDRLAGLDRIPALVQGVVVRSGIGSYDCEVRIADGQLVVCSTLAPVLSDIYGASQACLPVPGSYVLVWVQPVGLALMRTLRGIILGVVPENGTGGVSATGKSQIKKLADTEHPEAGVSQFTEQGPAQIASDSKFPYRGEFQCGRPHDIVPGEYALINHAGAGLVIGALSTTVKGSEAASVRCSALDDQVRIVSGHFRHISAAGSDEICNDNGFITVESAVSMYQSERLGVKGDAAFRWSPVDPLKVLEQSSGVTERVKGQTAKKRLYAYKGYLGDIMNIFVANPDPTVDVESLGSDAVDQGLFHAHVGAEGRLSVRSASGIILERYDRIPVPKRRHYAWDPEGDAETQPEEKRGFTLPGQYPMSAGLALGDMAAWWNHLSYARFRQFTKDFTVPEQDSLECPADAYDEPGKGTEDFQSYNLRHSYVALTPDGGIVLRDAWGSEIIMADGRITFNAAGNIEIRSGTSVVALGGKDVIAKAHGSVDVSATQGDVRLKAQGNLQAVSMERGILIQSKAKLTGNPDWTQVGEDLRSTGVVIKADESAVVLTGQKAAVNGVQQVSLTAFDAKGKPNGNVIAAGKQVVGAASDSFVATGGGSSGVIVSSQSAAVCAPSVVLAGGQSAGTTAGDKMLVGIPVDVPSMYSSLVSVCKTYVSRYVNDTAWLNPVPPTAFSEVDFRFRTSEQYGTTRDSGVTGGIFSVYEPSWAALAEAQRGTMKGVRTKPWEEEHDAGGGYPWPGKEAMGSGYVTYRESNFTEKATETARASDAQLTPRSFSSYHIRDL